MLTPISCLSKQCDGTNRYSEQGGSANKSCFQFSVKFTTRPARRSAKNEWPSLRTAADPSPDRSLPGSASVSSRRRRSAVTRLIDREGDLDGQCVGAGVVRPEFEFVHHNQSCRRPRAAPIRDPGVLYRWRDQLHRSRCRPRWSNWLPARKSEQPGSNQFMIAIPAPVGSQVTSFEPANTSRSGPKARNTPVAGL